MEFKRLAVLCGTSNDEEILNDPTGNRRIVIMNLLGKGDYEAFNKIDKEQLIAEALYEFNTGATSNINDEDQDMMNKATFDKHYQSTQEAEMIMKFFLPSTKSDNGTFMMATEIKDHIEKRKLWFSSDFLPADEKMNDNQEKNIKQLRDRSRGVKDEVRVAVALNLLTEEGLPHFHRLIAQHLGDRSFWAKWNNMWTAEEDRHGAAIRDYVRDARLFSFREVELMQFHYIEIILKAVKLLLL